jgi:hypothetical protein
MEAGIPPERRADGAAIGKRDVKMLPVAGYRDRPAILDLKHNDLSGTARHPGESRGPFLLDRVWMRGKMDSGFRRNDGQGNARFHPNRLR